MRQLFVFRAGTFFRHRCFRPETYSVFRNEPDCIGKIGLKNFLFFYNIVYDQVAALTRAASDKYAIAIFRKEKLGTLL